MGTVDHAESEIGRKVEGLGPKEILGSLSDGVYVTDLERRILYWNEAAERITGFSANEVVGKRCLDNLLCHIDKDGHPLCGKEHCPMHRSMQTGVTSAIPESLYALSREKERIPMQVTVAPLMDAKGNIVGAVESFRDMSQAENDLARARRVQQHAIGRPLPIEERLSFRIRYVPHDEVGGDFYFIERLDENHIAVLLADVMGHGMSAAMHTMLLRSLCQEHRDVLDHPSLFLERMNESLHPLVEGDSAFATALACVIDLSEGLLHYAGAGQSSPALFRGRDLSFLDVSGLPVGMMPSVEYEAHALPFSKGDVLLAYTDAAVEVENADGEELGEAGFGGLLERIGYPHARLPRIETELLRYSNGLRLGDDLTLLEIRAR